MNNLLIIYVCYQRNRRTDTSLYEMVICDVAGSRWMPSRESGPIGPWPALIPILYTVLFKMLLCVPELR